MHITQLMTLQEGITVYICI